MIYCSFDFSFIFFLDFSVGAMSDDYGYAENPSISTSSSAIKRTPGKLKKGEDASFSHVFTDDDQVAKYDAIVELLLAAGYFRARISGLSHFDKVIGGITWCISSSQVDVDIDLFFQEDSNMGMKMFVFLFSFFIF